MTQLADMKANKLCAVHSKCMQSLTLTQTLKCIYRLFISSC